MSYNYKHYKGLDANWIRLTALVVNSPSFEKDVKKNVTELLNLSIAYPNFAELSLPMEELVARHIQSGEVTGVSAYWTSSKEAFCLSVRPLEIVVIQGYQTASLTGRGTMNVRERKKLSMEDILDYLMIHQGASDLCLR